MTLRESINSYIDINGLVTPSLAPIPPAKGSDNGVCFTSEYYIYLMKNGEYYPYNDFHDYICVIAHCELKSGLVSRSPGDRGLQPPDDYLAIMAVCSQLGNPSIASKILKYGLKNYGCFNNANPGEWTKASFLWRQPQLIAATYAAAREGRFNPIVKILSLYSALVIAVACIGSPKEETDSRRLTFLLTQAMNPVSLLCRLAAKFWVRRQKQIYGDNFMAEVCKIYYQEGHPFGKYAKY